MIGSPPLGNVVLQEMVLSPDSGVLALLLGEKTAFSACENSSYVSSLNSILADTPLRDTSLSTFSLTRGYCSKSSLELL